MDVYPVMVWLSISAAKTAGVNANHRYAGTQVRRYAGTQLGSALVHKFPDLIRNVKKFYKSKKSVFNPVSRLAQMVYENRAFLFTRGGDSIVVRAADPPLATA